MTIANAWTPTQIQWGEPAPDGTHYALLEGRRDVPGALFTYAFFIPAGFWDAPHWHTQDARVVVVSGALHLGYGEEMRLEDAMVYGAGSVLVVPAGVRHFDGALEDTVIVGVASGVWHTQYVDPALTGSAGTV